MNNEGSAVPPWILLTSYLFLSLMGPRWEIGGWEVPGPKRHYIKNIISAGGRPSFKSFTMICMGFRICLKNALYPSHK